MLFPSVEGNMLNKEERYNRVPRLSDTHYSAEKELMRTTHFS